MNTKVEIKKMDVPKPKMELAVGQYYMDVEDGNKVYMIVKDIVQQTYGLVNVETGEIFDEMNENIDRVFCGYKNDFVFLPNITILVND